MQNQAKETSLGQQPAKRTNKPRPPVSSINNHQSKKCQCHFGKKTCPNQHIAISRSNNNLSDVIAKHLLEHKRVVFFFCPVDDDRDQNVVGIRVATRFDKNKARRESCSVLSVAHLALAPSFWSALDANASESILVLILRKGELWLPSVGFLYNRNG